MKESTMYKYETKIAQEMCVDQVDVTEDTYIDNQIKTVKKATKKNGDMSVKFISFLSDNNLMSKFITAVSDKYNIFNVDSFYEAVLAVSVKASSPESMVIAAFNWGGTADGGVFWSNVGQKWKKLLLDDAKKSKEQFNSIW